MADSVLRSLSSFAFSLALLLAMAGSAPTVTAQQLTLDKDTPISTLEEAIQNAESDSQLVAVARVLLEAREETKISHSTYRKGVSLFRSHHPSFYGNFFGDPFYATYDVRYQKLVRERQFIETEINPLNNYRTPTSFFCNPFSYDPAFNGVCKGFNFAASDFFFLPHPLQVHSEGTRSSLFATVTSFYSPSHDRKRAKISSRQPGEKSTEIDPCINTNTSACDQDHVPAAAERATSVQPAEPVEPEVDPADLTPTEIETFSAQEWANLGERLRNHLSPEERAELLSRLGETISLDDAPTTAPQFQNGTSRVPEIRRTLRRRGLEQPDRNVPDSEHPRTHRTPDPPNADSPNHDADRETGTDSQPQAEPPTPTQSRPENADNQTENETQQ